MSTPPTSDFSATRNFGLDVVRASAILMVLISHARQVLVNPDDALALTFGGWFGVELFFALSGFLIGTILIRLFEKGPTAGSLGRFWFRRWMRTLPAYFFILMFYWVWFGRVQPSDFVLLQWPLNQNQGVVAVSWSLAVEEWFYILFPIAALIATTLTKKHGFLFSIAVAVTAPVLFRVYQLHAEHVAIAFRLNPFRFDGMAYGVLAAYLLSREKFRTLALQHWRLVALAAALLFLADFWRHNGVRMGFPLPFPIPLWHRNVTSYTVSGICAALIVVVFYLKFPPLGKYQLELLPTLATLATVYIYGTFSCSVILSRRLLTTGA